MLATAPWRARLAPVLAAGLMLLAAGTDGRADTDLSTADHSQFDILQQDFESGRAQAARRTARHK